jgi:hypothetical protein
MEDSFIGRGENKMSNKSSRKRAIEAQCHECMGHYRDGKVDCENVRCPLYRWMVYRKLEPDTEWQKYSPRHVGKVTWAEINTEARVKSLQKAVRASQGCQGCANCICDSSVEEKATATEQVDSES